MKYRKLRIAWSATWGVVAMLLCVMWVRSYWRNDMLSISREATVISLWGDMSLCSQEPKGRLMPWSIVSERIEGTAWEHEKHVTESLLRSGAMFRKGFYISHNGRSAVAIPHWLLAIAAAAITPLPWVPFRFSLRTLLIATTLVAVGMGLIVWAARS